MADWVKFPDADSNRELFFRKSAVGAVTPIIGGFPAETEVVVSGVSFRLRTGVELVLRAILDVNGFDPIIVDDGDKINFG